MHRLVVVCRTPSAYYLCAVVGSRNCPENERVFPEENLLVLGMAQTLFRCLDNVLRSFCTQTTWRLQALASLTESTLDFDNRTDRYKAKFSSYKTNPIPYLKPLQTASCHLRYHRVRRLQICSVENRIWRSVRGASSYFCERPSVRPRSRHVTEVPLFDIGQQELASPLNPCITKLTIVPTATCSPCK